MTRLDWKLIFVLSLFGLAMAIATVFVIPSNIEPIVWLAIFIVCAYVIAKKTVSNRFLHGLSVSLLNSVWMTSAHIALADSYLQRHASEAAMMAKMPLPDSPRLMMLMTGPIVGIVSGIVLGGLAWVAGKLVGGRAR